MTDTDFLLAIGGIALAVGAAFVYRSHPGAVSATRTGATDRVQLPSGKWVTAKAEGGIVPRGSNPFPGDNLRLMDKAVNKWMSSSNFDGRHIFPHYDPTKRKMVDVGYRQGYGRSPLQYVSYPRGGTPMMGTWSAI